MQIPDPPTIAACATCMRPLTWLYSPRKTVWVAFVRNGDTITVHRCRDEPSRTPSWREQHRRSPEAVRAGAAKARAILAGELEPPPTYLPPEPDDVIACPRCFAPTTPGDPHVCRY